MTTIDTTLPRGDAETDAAEHRSRKLLTQLGLAFVVLAIVSGLATFIILTGLSPVSPTPNVIVVLLVINVGLVAALAGIIIWRIAILWAARRKRQAGARLQVRLVSLFAIVAAVPALLVALFASVTLDRGLDAWFSKRTRQIVDNALNVAQAYIQEHGQIIRIDAASMARDVTAAKPIYDTDIDRFKQRLAAQAAIRGLAAAYLINSNKDVLTQVTATQEPPLSGIPDEAMAEAAAGQIVVMSPGDTNRVRALLKLSNYDDTFLYIFRYVDPQVVDHLRTAFAGKVEYDSLENRRFGVQITFALMFVGVTLVFLLAAVWIGLWVADRMAQPIMRLVGAARLVSEGTLDVKVPIRKGDGDLSTLGRTFNQMTDQLSSQRNDLINANHMMDERRRFTEAVLSGVTAGVIGLDTGRRVTLVNRSAARLTGVSEAKALGRPITEIVPEMADILERALKKASGSAEGQITLMRDGGERTLSVRVTNEKTTAKHHGVVVTFDDISELVSAQRNSAWADIARRIAHEIKNPLTPIQLSAERLKRKYGRHIEQDKDIFEQCTDTIIRQVGDIGRMVDEFSAFARMPKAVLEPQDLNATVKEAVFLQQVSSNDIKIELSTGKAPLTVSIDRRLIAQAVTNLVKNAGEGVEARIAAETGHKGHILVHIHHGKDTAYIDVIDNGIGLPRENRQRLVEPYMTTRDKGTGLGLAIVKKIMEEHHGRISLHDAPGKKASGTGAMIRLELPMKQPGDMAVAHKKEGAEKPAPAKKSGKGKTPKETV